MTHVTIEPEGSFSLFGDVLMSPIMYTLLLIQGGSLDEVPQRTHFWNNVKLQKKQLEFLQSDRMVHYLGNSSARAVPGIVRHLIWSRYYVLAPANDQYTTWFVGWQYPDGAGGVSRIPLTGSARVLVAEGGTSFFGLSTEGYVQIPLKLVGTGELGDGSPFRRVVLL